MRSPSLVIIIILAFYAAGFGTGWILARDAYNEPALIQVDTQQIQDKIDSLYRERLRIQIERDSVIESIRKEDSIRNIRIARRQERVYDVDLSRHSNSELDSVLNKYWP